MSRRRRLVPYLAGAALAASLAACGGSSPGSPTPTPTPAPTPPPPQVVASGSDTLKAEETGLLVFNTTRAGKIDVTVDWTYATNDLDVAVVQGNCSFEQAMAQQCTVLGISVSETAKPEKVSVASAAAGTYTLFIENVGPRDESLSFQVVLTPSGTSAAPPTASSRGSQAMLLGQKRPSRSVVRLH